MVVEFGKNQNQIYLSNLSKQNIINIAQELIGINN